MAQRIEEATRPADNGLVIFHATEGGLIAHGLGVDLGRGREEDDAARRLELDGPNALSSASSGPTPAT